MVSDLASFNQKIYSAKVQKRKMKFPRKYWNSFTFALFYTMIKT